MYYKLATERFPLQIYVSALSLYLKQNTIRILCEDGGSEGIKILPSSGAQWDACQQKFESHSDRVI